MERGQDIAACAHCRQGGPYYLLLATNDYLPYYYLTVIPLPYLAQELPSAYLLLHLAKVALSGPLHTYYFTLPCPRWPSSYLLLYLTLPKVALFILTT